MYKAQKIKTLTIFVSISFYTKYMIAKDVTMHLS